MTPNSNKVVVLDRVGLTIPSIPGIDGNLNLLSSSKLSIS